LRGFRRLVSSAFFSLTLCQVCSKPVRTTRPQRLDKSRGLAQQQVRPCKPVVPPVEHILLREAQERRRAVPPECPFVHKAADPRQERLFRLCCLARRSFIRQPGTPDGGQEHAGVEFKRTLGEAIPINQTRGVTEVE